MVEKGFKNKSKQKRNLIRRWWNIGPLTSIACNHDSHTHWFHWSFHYNEKQNERVEHLIDIIYEILAQIKIEPTNIELVQGTTKA